MSSRHGPNEVGHSCVTMVKTKIFIGVNQKERNLAVIWIRGCNSPL